MLTRCYPEISMNRQLAPARYFHFYFLLIEQAFHTMSTAHITICSIDFYCIVRLAQAFSAHSYIPHCAQICSTTCAGRQVSVLGLHMQAIEEFGFLL